GGRCRSESRSAACHRGLQGGRCQARHRAAGQCAFPLRSDAPWGRAACKGFRAAELAGAGDHSGAERQCARGPGYDAPAGPAGRAAVQPGALGGERRVHRRSGRHGSYRMRSRQGSVGPEQALRQGRCHSQPGQRRRSGRRAGPVRLRSLNMSLEGKVALVTGASRGIGQAIAHALAAQWATVVGTATSDAGAASIAEKLTEAGFSGTGMKLDVRGPASISEVLDRITAEYGAPAILVNNAGITADNLLMRMKDEEWDDVIGTNLSSVYRLSKAVLRGMTKARWGRIICISSVVAGMGNGGQSNYAAAKAGMEGFTRALAREVGSRGITVNA